MSNEPDQVNTGALFATILLVAFATLGVALVVTSLVRDTLTEVSKDKDITQENAYRQLRASQVGGLTQSPAWADRATGMVSVPIESAMEMVLTEVRKNPAALTPQDPSKAEEETTDEAESEESPEGEETDAADAEETADKTDSEAASAPSDSAPTSPAPSEAAATPAPVAPKEAAPKEAPAPTPTPSP